MLEVVGVVVVFGLGFAVGVVVAVAVVFVDDVDQERRG